MVAMQPVSELLTSITLETPEGLKVEVLPFGATIKSIHVKDQCVTLQYPEVGAYLANPFYLGSTIGRYANRIANGRCNLNGKVITIDKGRLLHALHGGVPGFSHRLWRYQQNSPSQCTLRYCSPCGESGFPGELEVCLTITLSGLSVELQYWAQSTADTLVNLTNHCYFNLHGQHSDATDHQLKIAAAHYLPCSSQGLPTGEIRAVALSPFDFSKQTSIAKQLSISSPDLAAVNGFDHYFVFAKKRDTSLPVVELYSAKSGIRLSLYTSQEGVQFYAGNFLDAPFAARTGLCFEAQHWPDAPNHSHFPQSILKAGETYQQFIRYQFSL